MQTLYEMVRDVRGCVKEKSAALLSEGEIAAWINDGAEIVAREAMCVRRISMFAALDNVQEYDPRLVLPGYLDKVRQSWYRDRELRLIDTKYTGYGLMLPAGSQPTGLYHDPTLLLLWPRPSVTTYGPVGVTATFTSGSKTVTFAGGATLVTSGVATGWAIGKGATPTVIRRVLSVDSETSLTLDAPYDDTTAAGSTFLLTDGAVRVAYVGLPDPVILINENTGTIDFTQGSASLVGTGTKFSTNMRVGQFVGKGKRLTAEPYRFYRLATITDDTHATLDQTYREATAAAANYIGSDPTPLSYGDANAVKWFAMARAFSRYNNARMASFYEQKFEAAKLDARRESARRYALGEGHVVKETDATDQIMWRGLGG